MSLAGFDVNLAGLFEGYGGLTLAVQSVGGGQLGWYSEIEPAACRVLAHRHPDVPNLGDITQIDWASVPRPRILTGGFPCQDVSSAGRRLGIRPGNRSGLWTHMAYAIDQLRPELVVIENVRGLLSADAACDLEPCPWCLGDDEDRPLRALGAVLGDLGQLGYDARWGGLRAADVGAPHGRYRIFITAWPRAHPDTARIGRGATGRHDGLRPAGLVAGATPDACGGELQRRRVGGVLAGAEGAGAGEGPERERDRDTARDGSEDASHPDSVGPVRGGDTRGRRGRPADHDLAVANAPCTARRGTQPEHLGTPTGAAEPGERASAATAAPDPESERRAGGNGSSPDLELHRPQPPHLGAHGDRARWGDYAPAIHRWEQATGRPAPAPTMTGARGGQQLSPAFVEWMMGLAAGWVTAVPGVSRNEQLKMLGNGVVPQQAAAALRWLLATAGEVAA